jgi:two-component system, cell cycle sensor histidine kinase and response regulator CckA
MLQQELPLLDSRPVDGAAHWLVPAIVVASALTGAGILWISGTIAGALLFMAVSAIALPAVALLRKRSAVVVPDIGQLAAAPDYSIVGPILGLCADSAVLTDDQGRVLATNAVYRERFGAKAPGKLAADPDSDEAISAARAMAWRDGGGCAAGIVTGNSRRC